MNLHCVSMTAGIVCMAFLGLGCGGLQLQVPRGARAAASDSEGGDEAPASTPSRASGRVNGGFFDSMTSTLDSVARVLDKVQDVRGAARGSRKRLARTERGASSRTGRDETPAGGGETPEARGDEAAGDGGTSGGTGAAEGEAAESAEGEE